MKKQWLTSCFSPKGLLLLGGVALGAGYLVRSAGDQLLGWLPYLILLACPLMHLFMHRHHGQQAEHSPENSGKTESLEDTRKH